MPTPRYGGRRDANQSAIIKHANRIPGVKAYDLGAVGDGFPDALIAYKGVNYLAEIKLEPETGKVFKSQSQLNSKQVKWHKEHTGQVCIIRSLEDLWRLLGI